MLVLFCILHAFGTKLDLSLDEKKNNCASAHAITPLTNLKNLAQIYDWLVGGEDVKVCFFHFGVEH